MISDGVLGFIGGFTCAFLLGVAFVYWLGGDY